MADQDESSWERSKVIASWISAIAIPLVLAGIGYFVNLTLQTRESQGKMVELAVGILQSEPQNTEENKQIRDWAVNVIQSYSGVSISEKARRGLKEEPLPEIFRAPPGVFPQVFTIVGFASTQEAAITKAKDFLDFNSPCEPRIYQLGNQEYVVQLGGNLLPTQAEECLSLVKSSNPSTDAYNFSSRSARQEAGRIPIQ